MTLPKRVRARLVSSVTEPLKSQTTALSRHAASSVGWTTVVVLPEPVGPITSTGCMVCSHSGSRP